MDDAGWNGIFRISLESNPEYKCKRILARNQGRNISGGEYHPPMEENGAYNYCFYLCGCYFYSAGTQTAPYKQQAIHPQPGNNMPPLAANSTLLLFNALTLVL